MRNTRRLLLLTLTLHFALQSKILESLSLHDVRLRARIEVKSTLSFPLPRTGCQLDGHGKRDYLSQSHKCDWLRTSGPGPPKIVLEMSGAKQTPKTTCVSNAISLSNNNLLQTSDCSIVADQRCSGASLYQKRTYAFHTNIWFKR